MVRPLVCSYWGSEFVRVSVSFEEQQCSEILDFYWSFSQGSPVAPISSHQHTPLFHPPIFVSFCLLIHSLLYMPSFTSFMVRKIVWFGTSPVYNHKGCWWGGGGGRSEARTLCSSIGLWELANIVQARMRRLRLSPLSGSGSSLALTILG